MATSAVFAGLIASGTVASAHVIVSTTPNPDHGVIGTKDLVAERFGQPLQHDN
jgi:hypothetical protein